MLLAIVAEAVVLESVAVEAVVALLLLLCGVCQTQVTLLCKVYVDVLSLHTVRPEHRLTGGCRYVW